MPPIETSVFEGESHTRQWPCPTLGPVPTMRSPHFACALALLAAPIVLAAEQAPDIQSRLTAVEAAARSAQSAGDNAWMLVSAALVLMMTGPGLALFYGGLVRRKNVLGSMMHSFILMAVVTVVWAVVG